MALYNPGVTYRIQFNKEFTLRHLDAIIPYLKSLGVKTIYASPIFEAVPGSTHGYDQVNPLLISPEIGTEEELRDIVKRLHALGIGWLQDIVPNHMAFHRRNVWLMDVLEKGVQSTYADFFDTTWTSDLYKGRLMVPFLGATLEEVCDKQELSLVYVNDRLELKYYDNVWPVHSRTYESVLQSLTIDGFSEVALLLQQLSDLHTIEDKVQYALRWHEFLLQWKAAISTELGGYIYESIEKINTDSTLLSALANMQVYRLCHWRETDTNINYRRFFTINGLICLNMQSDDVFDWYHSKILTFVRDGVFQGLRIDHIDGLLNPAGYLDRLRAQCGSDVYITVEKILEHHEELPPWPIQGTTGYDFLALVNNVLTNVSGAKVLTEYYYELTGNSRSFTLRLHDKKANILHQQMAGELDNLYRLFIDSNLLESSQLSSLRSTDIKNAIACFLIHCPVYRYYINTWPLKSEEAIAVKAILKHCRESRPDLEAALTEQSDESAQLRALAFLQRCMQFSGPLMAKGMEDTLMYTFNRFIAHNEVGDSPNVFGITTDEFHQTMISRQQYWPLAINATATHDTKRGEDTRMRLNVLSSHPRRWIKQVDEWRRMNESFKNNGMPDENDEYLIYQTLIGSYWSGDDENYEERVLAYVEKALREAKRFSAWAEPNVLYEEASQNFVKAILRRDGAFWKSLLQWVESIGQEGFARSLTQTVLKFTCPGVTDIYQGTHQWDFSLVDPDNRRAVNYEGANASFEAQASMADAAEEQAFIASLWQQAHDGRIKSWLIGRLAQLRSNHADVLAAGAYVPLRVEGKYHQYILAFARQHQRTWVIVITMLAAPDNVEAETTLENFDWSDTRVLLPSSAPQRYVNMLFGDDEQELSGSKLLVGSILKELPVAVLRFSETPTERAAGILLPIASLPSPFRIGDVGPAARSFAGFLHRARQRYWQILPVQPVSAGASFSPYSSYSAFAGNVLLISPEDLQAEGYLTRDEVDAARSGDQNKIDYAEATKVKERLLDIAWKRYQQRGINGDRFHQFKQEHKVWLDDFALYLALKIKNYEKPWYQWPDEYRLRDEEALLAFDAGHTPLLEKIKWEQYVFFSQWSRLKASCTQWNVKLFGDLPFYVSYDSADVWANPRLFNLDDNGRMTYVAGVPPDYFNAEGQLWGMPTYRWLEHQADDYAWWMNRIRHNLALFDVLRFDHFRAFANYWEVSATETSAVRGKWKDGPGKEFMRKLQTEFPDMPFIAEDLGDIDEAVFELRDDFDLPGMKVLQFAFSDVGANIYAPHHHKENFVVYTGTHDNNTTRGWFVNDATVEEKENLSRYLQTKVSSSQVSEKLVILALSSVAKLAIVPLQDYLNLDESARMNKPSSIGANWQWKSTESALTPALADKLSQWTSLYGR